MRKYEIMYIVKSTLDEASFLEVVNNTNNIITNNGGVIESVDNWGLRDFAYEINKMHKGYYVVLKVSADNQAIFEFERLARISDSVIRHMITKLD